MLEKVELVSGATASKDIVPVLTHVNVQGEYLQATDGRITCCTPAPTDPALPGTPERPVNVPCKKLLQALRKAPKGATIKVSETQDGRLQLQAGRLRVRLPLSEEAFPGQDAPTAAVGIDGEALVQALQLARPFVAEDGSKPWATGVLMHPSGVVMATNNVTIVRVPCTALQADRPPVTVPVQWVDEVLRLQRLYGAPVAIEWGEAHVVAVWQDGTWLHAATVAEAWPDTAVSMVPDAPEDPATEGEPLADLRQAVALVTPFSPDEKAPVVELSERGAATAQGEGYAAGTTEAELVTPEGGAGYPPGRYRAEVLDRVLALADRVWLDRYPQPIPFAGPDGVVGLFVGVR